jgi:hypothetical protein
MQTRPILSAFVGVVISIFPHSVALADNTAPRPQIQVPHATALPRMDAQPDDPAWASAALIPSLTVSLGKAGEGVTAPPTQVRLLWDEQWLYIRFTCTGNEAYSPFTHHGDKLYQADVVEVFLDPKGDGKQWLEVEVSPNNVTMEVQTTLTAEPKSDADLMLMRDIISRDFWNNLDYSVEGMRTAATITRAGEKVTGWTVDIALPAKVVMRRFGVEKYSPATMRANFMRYEYPTPARANGKRALIALNWAPVVWGCPHISPAAMGYITLSAPAGTTK